MFLYIKDAVPIFLLYLGKTRITVLIGCNGNQGLYYGLCLLGLKLVWQYQIRMLHDLLVCRYNVLVDIDPALITHDRIKD